MAEAVEAGEVLDQSGMDAWYAKAAELKGRWGKELESIPAAGGNLWLRIYLGGYNRRNGVPE